MPGDLRDTTLEVTSRRAMRLEVIAITQNHPIALVKR